MTIRAMSVPSRMPTIDQQADAPLISLIILTYNYEFFITTTLQKVQALRYHPLEVIVVDNHSTDRTWALTNEYAAESNRNIRCYRKPNEGPAAARNFGFARTSPESRYVFFLDGDDYLHFEALNHLVAYMEAHPEVGLLGCQYERIDTQGRYLGPGWRSRWIPGRFLPRELREQEHFTPFSTFFCTTGQGPFALFRCSVFKQTQGYTEAFWSHEDSDIFCQMALVAEVHYLPQRLYYKREHDRNLTRLNQSRDYEAFRYKWDNYQAPTLAQQQLIEQARWHYYRRHAPLRDLKVARKAFSEFLREPRTDRLRRIISLIKSGLRGLMNGNAMLKS